jgi:hypothetical protein
MGQNSFWLIQSGQLFLGVFDLGTAGVAILQDSENSAIVLDIFFLLEDLALSFRIHNGNLIGLPDRGFCVEAQELGHLLEEKVALFIGQHRLFVCPEGYDDAFACFLIRHEISALEAFLLFALGNNVRFEKPDGLIDPVDFQLNPEQTRKHGTSSFSLTEDPYGAWSISWPDVPFRQPGQRIPILEP